MCRRISRLHTLQRQQKQEPSLIFNRCSSVEAHSKLPLHPNTILQGRFECSVLSPDVGCSASALCCRLRGAPVYIFSTLCWQSSPPSIAQQPRAVLGACHLGFSSQTAQIVIVAIPSFVARIVLRRDRVVDERPKQVDTFVQTAVVAGQRERFPLTFARRFAFREGFSSMWA